MNEITELLPAVALGIATPQEVRLVKTALESDAGLRAEYAALELVLTGLGASEVLNPPPSLKNKILAAARDTSSTSARDTSSTSARVIDTPVAVVPMHPAPQSHPPQRQPRVLARVLPWALAGLAAALTAVFLNLPQAASINATTLATTADGSIIYANSGAVSRTTPAVYVRSDGSRTPIQFVADKECVFKAAVSSDGLTYLLDSANNTVFIVDEKTSAVVDKWSVPSNATAMDVVGSTVVVRSSQVALIFRRNQSGKKSMVEARLSSANNANPEAAVIDGDRLYTTDQMAGVVHVLSSTTGKEISTFTAAKAPISLAVRDGLWVLDASGALYKLEVNTGAVQFRVALEGTPQLLRLTDQFAFIADKEGFISVVDLVSQQVTARKRLQNPAMALSLMPDGHLAVALEKRGVVVLDSKLEVIKTIL